MSVEVEMFTLIIFHKIKENIRSDNKEWIQAHTKLIRLCMRLFLRAREIISVNSTL